VAVLEAPERRREQDPEGLWERIGLRPGDVVVDVGAGSGYFAIPAARRVGPQGRVYAVDLSVELVELVRERARSAGLVQLEARASSLEHIPLPDGLADLVLLANVLHDIPPSTVGEAVRLLRPGGRLIDLDWKKEPGASGPPESVRLSPSEAEHRLAGHGLRVVERWEDGEHHYGLLLSRRA
jgi:ubiquinone/menaquinone biosynthesis C-methylase UbiE